MRFFPTSPRGDNPPLRRPRGIRRGLAIAFLGAAVALLGTAGTAFVADVDPKAGMDLPLAVLMAFVALGIAACWTGFTLFDGHFDDLERLRSAVVAFDPSVGAAAAMPRADDEAGRLAAAILDLTRRAQAAAAAPDRRLAAIVGALDRGVLAITETGLVSLVNGAAAAALGPMQVGVGTSIFDALDRDGLVAAIGRARVMGRPIGVRLMRIGGGAVEGQVAALGDGDGAVLMLAASRDAEPGIAHDLALHDRPPPTPSLTDDLALDDLPFVVLDTETTGLDVADDRIVSIGAVRGHGRRIYPTLSFDRLVRPGRPIPARATRIHGITDAMVAEAPPFATVWQDLQPLIEGCVLVGHNIGFDRAVLARHCVAAGLPWPDPPSLCTARLAAGLDPKLNDLNLEALADRFGLPVEGRHTAFGDVLLTAALYGRLTALMKEAGIVTFGAAKALSARPRHLVALQKRAGW